MRIVTRFLRRSDVPSVLALELRQWTAQQAADEATLLRRIQAWPELCVGAFCAQSGRALASLFMKPALRREIEQADRWEDCACVGSSTPPSSRSLFGISFTSVDAEGAWRVIEFFWPHALKSGWRDIYLGSPMPGFRRARERDQGLDPRRYAAMKRGGLPLDPQLRYYHGKGFREIVAVREGYFPHPDSLDHAALLRGRVPLSGLWPVWRCVPLPALQRLSGAVRRLVVSPPAVTRGRAGRLRFFDALSHLLPCGEGFVIRAVSDWLSDERTGRRADEALRREALRREAQRFVREELAHQRAHQLHNERLAGSSDVARDVTRGLDHAVEELDRWSLRNRLALAAAFEHLTALLSAEVLRHPAWLARCAEAEAKMWRWHCREELGHRDVVGELLAASGVGYARRASALLMATCWLGWDLARLMGRLEAQGVGAAGRRGLRVAARAARFAGTVAPGLLRMGLGWAGYLVPRLR